MTTKAAEIRIVAGVGSQIREVLARPAGRREPMIMAFVSLSRLSRALIVREIIEPPDEASIEGPYGAEWSHRWTVRLAQRAEQSGTGICILHHHRGQGHPRLSRIDVESLHQVGLAIGQLFPTTLVGSVVFSDTWQASGHVINHGRNAITIDRARWLGPWIEKLPAPPAWRSQKSARTDTVWAEQGQGGIRAARIGIIGAGGGGSHLVQQFAHVDIGTLVVVDPDVVDDSNRSRMVGTRKRDIGRPKLAPMARLVGHAGDVTRLIQIPDRFPSPSALEALGTCDIIMSCVDTLSSRKDVMEFAWQHAIPLIDIGLTIDPSVPPPGVKAIGGQVFVGVPGGPCMWCEGILSHARLQAEKDAEGYVRGGGAAQVISLNGVLASQAVTEALNLVTGFLGDAELPPARLIFDGRALVPVRRRRLPCELCKRVGAGDVAWTPLASAASSTATAVNDHLAFR